MKTKNNKLYLHGFSLDEQMRLYHQANILRPAIYQHLKLGSIRQMLEVGCGVGAQSNILLENYPKMHLQSIDQSDEQLLKAEEFKTTLTKSKSSRWQIEKMNAAKMLYKNNTYDGAFLCWILEHINRPEKVVAEVFRVLKPGGGIIATEVMNSSFFIDPFLPHLWEYWQKLNQYQFSLAGDPYIGIKLRSIFHHAGFENIILEGRVLHFDETCGVMKYEFLLYWQDLMFSAEAQLLRQKVITRNLSKLARQDFKKLLRMKKSIFTYTFFQCTADKPNH